MERANCFLSCGDDVGALGIVLADTLDVERGRRGAMLKTRSRKYSRSGRNSERSE